MFGLEKEKQQVKREPYDLELELRDPVKLKKIKESIESKIQALKQLLRQGENKEEFDQYGVLLHAYAALQKVIKRLAKK